MWSRVGIFVVMLAVFLSLGMGRLDQNGKPGEIPIPDKDISVTLTDKEGVTITLNQFSLYGQTALSGKLGAGRVTIPFSQVRLITFSNGTKGVTAKIDLSDQSQITLQLEKGLMVTGRIKMGTYQVSLEKLMRIEILSVSEKKSP
jgi:hypothetical protein